jgi:hypothetical protein
MEKEHNNIAWKFILVLCIVLFGAFLYFLVFKNRRGQLAFENQENDNQNIMNDWQNIFGDLQNVFNKITK